MTDKAPERIWVCPQYEEKAFHDFEFGGWPEYVRADILEAAQARIAELIGCPIGVNDPLICSAGSCPDCLAKRVIALTEELATARAEALEEAAKVADARGFPTCADAIRALKGADNG